MLRVVRKHRRGPIFVWGVWAALSLVALACLALYTRNVPLSEDWTLVPALTGNQPDVLGWLWSQNNEHRVPVPRLMLLGALTLTGGDFRAGGAVSVLCLVALAAMAILVARRLRGGRIRYTDAFLPIAFLHLGNWENLFWSWQLTFVTSVVLICGLLYFVLTHSTPVPLGATVLAGSALVLLPLTGASGLVFVPALALYLLWQGFRQWRERTPETSRWPTLMLLAFPVVALIVTALYFLGYESPAWYPTSRLNVQFAKTSLKFLAIGLGPAAAQWWAVCTITVTVAIGYTAILLLTVIRSQPAKRSRAIGLLLVLASVGVMAIGIGRGRGAVPDAHIPIRYVLLALPALLTAYFAAELYASRTHRRTLQGGLLAIVLLLLPLNIRSGLEWRDWYLDGMDRVLQDVEAGVPRSELAERHRAFLLHWDVERLKASIGMLQEAGIGPFAQLPDETGVKERQPPRVPLPRVAFSASYASWVSPYLFRGCDDRDASASV
ncbi:MAG: hypothetical protein M3198_01520 [Actinomycetota bacterium]|nr:hypothetical protein [Actinomycetota bacterium]